MLKLGEYVRIRTVDSLHYAGPVRAVTDAFVRIYDERDGRDIILAWSSISRAEVRE